MSLVETYHAEHKARMARLSPAPKPKPVAAPVVVKQTVVARPGPVFEIEKSCYPQMWFWQLVNFVPRRPNSSIASHIGPRIEDIQRLVCKSYGISKIDLLSDRRTAKVIWPRHVAMFIARELTTQSLPEIGRRFNGRDHTTTLSAVRKIERLIKIDPILAARIEDLKAEVLA